MESESKKQALFLGVRIGIAFLISIVTIIFVTYLVLSHNFHNLLTDYSIQLVQSMTSQGVKTIEYELEMGRKEVSILANSFEVPTSENQKVKFPQTFQETDYLRMIYVSEPEISASDGRQRDIRHRQDILSAYHGESAIYGPYFNEEGEYVICYSAPVKQNGTITGVLSIEKDGYRFCKLIENIRFINSGEAYIINAEGTDIAVSDPEHISWVTSEYNAQKLFEERGDPVTKSILELEQKGLQGETGFGTYEWEGSLCYVVYQPIPSVNWVLLGGLRKEEITSMTQFTLLTSISKGPVLIISFLLLFLLTGLIIFWIISSMKKNNEINEKLEMIANHDSLTGLLNRRFLENNLSKLWKYPIKVSSPAAVFMIDIDNFKKYNDFYGHQKGDDCLRHVANIFKNAFNDYNSNVMRYGGEEFVAVIFSISQKSALEQGQKICRLVEKENLPNGSEGVVTVSIGICHVDITTDAPLYDCIKIADQALYQAKKEGKNRTILLSISSKKDIG